MLNVLLFPSFVDKNLLLFLFSLLDTLYLKNPVNFKYIKKVKIEIDI
jgi:hypothetical protein